MRQVSVRSLGGANSNRGQGLEWQQLLTETYRAGTGCRALNIHKYATFILSGSIEWVVE